jgi:hypothetical protein
VPPHLLIAARDTYILRQSRVTFLQQRRLVLVSILRLIALARIPTDRHSTPALRDRSSQGLRHTRAASTGLRTVSWYFSTSRIPANAICKPSLDFALLLYTALGISFQVGSFLQHRQPRSGTLRSRTVTNQHFYHPVIEFVRAITLTHCHDRSTAANLDIFPQHHDDDVCTTTSRAFTFWSIGSHTHPDTDVTSTIHVASAVNSTFILGNNTTRSIANITAHFMERSTASSNANTTNTTTKRPNVCTSSAAPNREAGATVAAQIW